METVAYPARYKDRFGKQQTTILNDGKTLTMVLRGVQFQGDDFDSFTTKDTPFSQHLASFTFLHGHLGFCVIEADIPILVMTPLGIVNGLLTFELKLGTPLATNQMNREQLKLRLTANEQTFYSAGKTGWFEGEMRDLHGRLPLGMFMKTCINCAFSDYSPYGHGLFGNLICFRANKTGYLALPSGEDFSKDDYFDVMDTVSEMVQETHLCPEFEKRVPGTGYRG